MQSAAPMGAPRIVGEWALHVQCHWRIVQMHRVVVGSQDINYPADHSYGDEVPEEFDWNRDRSRLDRLIGDLFARNRKGYRVRAVEAGAASGLRIALEESMSLELFPGNSLPAENWRLFKPDAHEPHFVV